ELHRMAVDGVAARRIAASCADLSVAERRLALAVQEFGDRRIAGLSPAYEWSRDVLRVREAAFSSAALGRSLDRGRSMSRSRRLAGRFGNRPPCRMLRPY